jgi:hypothetical protein
MPIPSKYSRTVQLKPATVNPQLKIFVGGLGSAKESDLHKCFAPFGRILDCVVIEDHLTGHSRGFGFVTFGSSRPVDWILEDPYSHFIAGRRVEVKRACAQPVDTGPPRCRLCNKLDHATELCPRMAVAVPTASTSRQPLSKIDANTGVDKSKSRLKKILDASPKPSPVATKGGIAGARDTNEAKVALPPDSPDSDLTSDDESEVKVVNEDAKVSKKRRVGLMQQQQAAARQKYAGDTGMEGGIIHQVSYAKAAAAFNGFPEDKADALELAAGHIFGTHVDNSRAAKEYGSEEDEEKEEDMSHEDNHARKMSLKDYLVAKSS